jgi:glycosyltransferase involved in cell wall biosynthesis
MSEQSEIVHAGAPILSILICSIEERADQLGRLKRSLEKQGAPSAEVQVLTEVDNRVLSVGDKRNRLLDRSRGAYVAFIDDDDQVSSNYVRLVVEGCRTGCDCCSLLGVHYIDGRFDANFEHSIKHNSWERLPGGLYIRPPNHLNAVRRDYALRVRFPGINVGEDHDYCLRLREYLKTEHPILEPIYKYQFSAIK